MADEKQYIIHQCTNPACGKKFKVPEPPKAGTFPLKCPHCGAPNKVTFAGNSAAAPKTVEDEIRKGEEYTLVCPHCGKEIRTFTPAQAGSFKEQCPTCAGRIIFNVTAVTEVRTADDDDSRLINICMGQLVMIRKWLPNKQFPLKVGHNVIGRADQAKPSDISITGDPAMSRRSVEIEVRHDSSAGLLFKLKILNAANPVLLNDKPMSVNDAEALNFGDTLVLGQTRFRFDKVPVK